MIGAALLVMKAPIFEIVTNETGPSATKLKVRSFPGSLAIDLRFSTKPPVDGSFASPSHELHFFRFCSSDVASFPSIMEFIHAESADAVCHLNIIERAV
jgi:hypothetical protein